MYSKYRAQTIAIKANKLKCRKYRDQKEPTLQLVYNCAGARC